MIDLKQVDLKQVRDEVADRVGRAAKELSSGAGNAARELGASAESSISKQIRQQAKLARNRMPRPAAYLFDPERGRARRAMLADRVRPQLRRGWHVANQLRTRTSAGAAAFPQRMVQLRSLRPRPADDLTLRDRVESEVFRNADLPKGRINFDVESGVVTIRGQVDNAYQIANVEKAVLKVPGVAGVENLLHVDGTPAPNKAQSRKSATS
jgi:hypothetical protein